MIEVGVRQLKNGLSGYLRRVARGERVRVTMRGKPLADLVPAGRTTREDEGYRRLVAEGRITPASRAHPGRAPSTVRASRAASELILAEREEDR